MVVASIDLMDGKAVQLVNGERKVLEVENPLELAEEFNKYGDIAVIDLDRVFGKGDNRDVVKKICGIGNCRVGGGIRSIEDVREIISWGAEKVIIGSLAFKDGYINYSFLDRLKEEIGTERVMIAVDARGEDVVCRGWTEKSGFSLFEAVDLLREYCSGILCTSVEKEGMMEGGDLELIKELRSRYSGYLTVAGGISSIEEISEVSALGADIQLGMALYTEKISLGEAFVKSLDWSKGLIPVTTVDSAQQVLMNAWCSEESLGRAFESGKMCYFSRSRNSFWTKGESSGNFQYIKKIRTDCDRDSLLLTVDQKGVACHRGSYSCYGDREFTLEELYQVIGEKFENCEPGSYTATLDDRKVREKIMEEAEEVVTAEDRDNLIWEVADLLYFTLVLMNREKITLREVLTELRRRRRGGGK